MLNGIVQAGDLVLVMDSIKSLSRMAKKPLTVRPFKSANPCRAPKEQTVPR